MNENLNIYVFSSPQQFQNMELPDYWTGFFNTTRFPTTTLVLIVNTLYRPWLRVFKSYGGKKRRRLPRGRRAEFRCASHSARAICYPYYTHNNNDVKYERPNCKRAFFFAVRKPNQTPDGRKFSKILPFERSSIYLDKKYIYIDWDDVFIRAKR